MQDTGNNTDTRMRIEIYDPALCCSSGLCGPQIDPLLVEANDTVLRLKKQGVAVERFNLAQQPHDYVANPTISALMNERGKDALPVTLINGEVLKIGAYPDYEELCKALRIEPLSGGRHITIIPG